MVINPNSLLSVILNSFIVTAYHSSFFFFFFWGGGGGGGGGGDSIPNTIFPRKIKGTHPSYTPPGTKAVLVFFNLEKPAFLNLKLLIS